MGRPIAFIAFALAATLAAAAPASASLGDEVQAGQTVARQLEAGKTTCGRLTTDDFEHLGEYVMGRMVGSLQLHDAMNQRMRSMMGADNENRMHVLMGQRYAGCAATGKVGPMMGASMMGGRGWTDDRAWGSMMRAGGWQWMRDGTWQRMSRADWERVSDQWMGPGMMRAGDHDWHARDVALVGAGLVLAAGLVAALVAAASQRRRAATSTR